MINKKEQKRSITTVNSVKEKVSPKELVESGKTYFT